MQINWGLEETSASFYNFVGENDIDTTTAAGDGGEIQRQVKPFHALSQKQQRRVSQPLMDNLNKITGERQIGAVNLSGYLVKRFYFLIYRN